MDDRKETGRFSTKWLTFGKLDMPDRKTEVWQVISIKGIFLGDIKWFGRWRAYAFFPDEKTVYNSECLKDVAAMITWLMNERKK